jgi:hypothetical protein
VLRHARDAYCTAALAICTYKAHIEEKSNLLSAHRLYNLMGWRELAVTTVIGQHPAPQQCYYLLASGDLQNMLQFSFAGRSGSTL